MLFVGSIIIPQSTDTQELSMLIYSLFIAYCVDFAHKQRNCPTYCGVELLENTHVVQYSHACSKHSVAKKQKARTAARKLPLNVR